MCVDAPSCSLPLFLLRCVEKSDCGRCGERRARVCRAKISCRLRSLSVVVLKTPAGFRLPCFTRPFSLLPHLCPVRLRQTAVYCLLYVRVCDSGRGASQGLLCTAAVPVDEHCAAAYVRALHARTSRGCRGGDCAPLLPRGTRPALPALRALRAPPLSCTVATPTAPPRLRPLPP
jgi:hypothetical protein